MRGSSSAGKGLWVLTMSEDTQEMTAKEITEALRNMERANRAMARIFNLDEKEGDNE